MVNNIKELTTYIKEKERDITTNICNAAITAQIEM